MHAIDEVQAHPAQKSFAVTAIENAKTVPLVGLRFLAS